MQKTSSCSAKHRRARRTWLKLLPACLLLIAPLIQAADLGENLSGFYAREGNNGSPAKTAGNNIYIKFFDDRWVGMMFIPYPYAREVSDEVVSKVFAAARKQAKSAFRNVKY